MSTKNMETIRNVVCSRTTDNWQLVLWSVSMAR